jgi:hypothetical protein
MATDITAVNNHFRDGNFFNSYRASFVDGSAYDEMKIKASLEAQFLDFLKQTNFVPFTTEIGLGTMKNEYAMYAEAGDVGSVGGEIVQGNIPKEDHDYQIFFTLPKKASMRTKYHTLTWNRIRQIAEINEGMDYKVDYGVNKVLDVEFTKPALSKMMKLYNAHALYGLFDQYQLKDMKTGTTIGTKQFDLQTKYLSKIDRKFSFKSLALIERALREGGKMPYGMLNSVLTGLIYVPATIFDKCIKDLIEESKANPTAPFVIQFMKSTSTYNNLTNTYTSLGAIAGITLEVACEYIKEEFKFNGFLVKRSTPLDERQMFAPGLITGTKNHHIAIVLENAFRISNPKSQEMQEYNSMTTITTQNDQRRMFNTQWHGIEMQERMVGAAQAQLYFNEYQYNASGSQVIVPSQFENACMFEIDGVATMEAPSQAVYEASVEGANAEPTLAYKKAFYTAGHLDEAHEFIRPIV